MFSLPKLFNISHSRVERWVHFLSLQRCIIWLESRWHTLNRTRTILPLLPLNQIRQGTHVHSRPTSRISYRDGLTFYTVTNMQIINNSCCGSLTEGCWICEQQRRWQQQQQVMEGTRQRQAMERHTTAGDVLLENTQYINNSNSRSRRYSVWKYKLS